MARSRPCRVRSPAALLPLVLLGALLSAAACAARRVTVATLEKRAPVHQLPNRTRGFPRYVRLVEPVHDALAARAPRLARLLQRLRLRAPAPWVSRFHDVQLYGGMVAVGEYYAKVRLGGQTLRVQIDTGSATLAVPVKECSDCKRGDMRYSYEESDSGIAELIGCEAQSCGENTCSPFGCGGCSKRQACCAVSDESKCAFHLNFGDGSGAKGVLVRDTLEWGDVKFPVTFGGIRSDSPDFERSQVDGILGMAYPSLACNPSCITPTFESMLESVTMKNMFSICITYDSGKIVLGDYDPALSTHKVTWVDLDLSSPPSFYSFPLIGNLRVNDKDLPLPSYSKAIVDSGTTLIVFSHATFDKFKAYLQDNFCDVPGLCGAQSWFRPAHCTKIADEDRMKLPTLKFGAKGFDVVLGPDEYLINYASKGPEYWCVGIMALNSMSGGVDVIFGNTVMKKYVTIYDRDNHRVGFAESDTNCALDVHSEDGGTLLPLPDGVPKEHGEGEESADDASETEASDPADSSVEKGPPQEETPLQEQEQSPKQKHPRHHDDSKDESSPRTGSDDVASSICSKAATCMLCSKITERPCRWVSATSRCENGDGGALMCTLDGLAGKFVYVVGGALVAVVVLVVVVAAVVQSYRKRQGNSVGAGEEVGEVERPLARHEADTRSAFAIDDEER